MFTITPRTSAARARIPNPAYPSERVLPGITTRLLTEDWNAMTAAARASENHVSRQERWTKKARAANPALSDEQAERLGEMLKREHYSRMGKLSAQSKRAAAAQDDEAAA